MTSPTAMVFLLIKEADLKLRTFAVNAWLEQAGMPLFIIQYPIGFFLVIKNKHIMSKRNFYRIEELNLNRGGDPDTRLDVLKPIFDNDDKYDVLDVGCAEAIIGKKFGNHFKSYHGVDLNTIRLGSAHRILAKYLKCPYTLSKFHFSLECDLTAFDRWGEYDVVLFLSCYNHIPVGIRTLVLLKCLKASKQWFAIRSGAKQLHEREGLDVIIRNQGFELHATGDAAKHQAVTYIYKKVK